MRNPRHKRARRLPQPLHLENHYMAELGQVALLSQRVVAELVTPALSSFGVHKIIQDAVAPDPFGGRVTKKVFEVFPPELLEKMVRMQGQRVSQFHRQAITRQLTDAVGVGFWVGRRMDDHEVNKLLEQWVKDNVALIKTLPTEYLAKVETAVQKGVGAGLRVEELSDKIMAMGNVVKARANLIARDQTLKLYGRLNRERQKSVGIERYAWRGVLDEAERPMHRDLEGQVFRWGEPPVTNEDGDENEPGEDYQCRCDAEPIFD
jgi:SPP1 gp7 family putative phage head morphogenesis protein